MLPVGIMGDRAFTIMLVSQRYVRIGAVTALYFLAGKAGLHFFGLVHPSASAVWPPTGVAIAGLLLFGYRVWPAIFTGAFLVNVTTAGSVVTSVGIATGNTLEALAAVYLVNRFARGPHTFERAPDVLSFIVLAALLSTTLSATFGVLSLVLTGFASFSTSAAIWVTWWLGDASGAAIVTPLLLLWYHHHRFNWEAKRVIEAALLFVAGTGLGIGIFFTSGLAPYPLAFLSLPPLVWAAFRFGPREVATAVALLSVMATWATATGQGPFVMSQPNDSLLVLQTFMIIVATTALPMGALVAERALLLEQERDINRRKDEFLATLSHELRNPLEAITSAAAVLERLEGRPEEATRWRKVIQRQAKHLAHLIDDLLDTARIVAGKMALTRSAVNLAALIEHCVRTLVLAGTLPRHQIQLHLSSAWVNADPDRLEQVINNLITNANKYTLPGGTIQVHTHMDGGYAILEVEDTGIGIAPELLPRIFDPFIQGDQGLARSRGGIGIGLALVRKLIELHGGSVEAQSEGTGRGSRFVVRLPAIAAPAIHVEPAATPALPPSRRRILVIDDNADIRDSLRALLELWGHDVHEAADGVAGTDAALQLQPDIALIDIGLPCLDGYEVARRLKAAKVKARLVALTGYGMDEDKQRAQAAGFDLHVLKPLSAERLQAVIEELSDWERSPSFRAVS